MHTFSQINYIVDSRSHTNTQLSCTYSAHTISVIGNATRNNLKQSKNNCQIFSVTLAYL